MKLDVITSRPWYADHIRPVWDALPTIYRGQWYGPEDKAPRIDNPTLVAGTGDLGVARSLTRPVALMEHGAGQSYGGDRRGNTHPSYAGGGDRAAELFLHPGPHSAMRDIARYPNARVEVVGCPKLDTLPERDHSLDMDNRPVVAVSFHWDCYVAPETRSGFIYFRDAVKETPDFHLIGHGHPRIMERLRPWYQKKGIEVVSSFDEVLRRADLYVCDNSSSLFEFAATGRPVVVMNPPFYRRTINHGLRFWEAAEVGLNCDTPSQLTSIIVEALKDPEHRRLAREEALDKVYTPQTGGAKLAADILIDWLTSR